MTPLMRTMMKLLMVIGIFWAVLVVAIVIREIAR